MVSMLAALRPLLSQTARYHATSTAPPLTLASKSHLIRPFAGPSTPLDAPSLANDFFFWPEFLTADESREVLQMALWKLDRVDTARRRRRKAKNMEADHTGSGSGLQDLFDGAYGFEEGHYDSVIHDYRETLLSSLPPSPSPGLSSILARLYSLLPHAHADPDSLPPPKTSTHLLHLSPKGSILPHVDNLQASGSVILGLSLGAERTMRLRRKGGEGGWDLRLPSGSVYLQRDSIRYEYEHSILPYEDDASRWDGQELQPGHRVSIMIRDAPSRPANL